MRLSRLHPACLALLASLLAPPAVAQAPGEPPAAGEAAAEAPEAPEAPDAAEAGEPEAGERRGLAEPDGERWGDEWYEDRSGRIARELEQKMIEEAAAKAAVAAEPAPAPAEPAPSETPRPLLRPAHGVEALHAAWRERREALLRQDLASAREAEARLEALRAELDVREAHAFAVAAVRESRKLKGASPEEAVERARFASRLAPSLPLPWLQLASASFAADPLDPGAAEAAAEAVRATFRDPRASRQLLVHVASAAALALLASGALLLVFLSLRHGRAVLHDFHHRFPRGVAPAQTAAAAALVLAVPLLLGLGPLAVAALVIGALWLYLARGERVLLALWLSAAGAIPAGASWLALHAQWEGTPAADLYALERAGDFEPLRRLSLRAEAADAPPETLFAVARARKRLGDLEGAKALYERALRARPRWPAASVNLGNVRFIEGDLAGAERLYTQAIDRDPSLAAAYFDLSRLHFERVNFGAGQQARARAMELDPALVERHSAEEGGRLANRFLADATLSDEELAAAALGSREPERLERQLGAALLGPLPAAVAPWALPAWAALLFLAPLAASRARPAAVCTRCGRPVCGDCDPETAGGAMCGQCVHVFGRRAAVDPLAKAVKERASARHFARRTAVQRVADALLAGPALSGRLAIGAPLLLAGWTLAALALEPASLVRPLYDTWPAALRLGLLLPACAGVWALGLRAARGGG